MIRANLIKRKKGISPIIATLLLILIAIAAGVIVYAYVVGFIGNSVNQNGTGPSSETFNINSWYVNSTGSAVSELFVQNTGANSINVTSVYFYSSSGALFGSNITIAAWGAAHGTGVIIGAGQTKAVYAVGITLTAGTYYQAKVVTANGGTAVSALQKA